jgi:hypothetical protein
MSIYNEEITADHATLMRQAPMTVATWFAEAQEILRDYEGSDRGKLLIAMINTMQRDYDNAEFCKIVEAGFAKIAEAVASLSKP